MGGKSKVTAEAVHDPYLGHQAADNVSGHTRESGAATTRMQA